tara:strand:- start:5928 stop:6290 length:363 start_codon:yes stop_codon:yes gene_type:complete
MELKFQKNPEDTVLAREPELAKILTFIGGSRDPDAPSLAQLRNVDSGGIHCVHIEERKGTFLLETAYGYKEKDCQINSEFDCCFNCGPFGVHQSKTSIKLYSWRSCSYLACLSFEQCNVY